MAELTLYAFGPQTHNDKKCSAYHSELPHVVLRSTRDLQYISHLQEVSIRSNVISCLAACSALQEMLPFSDRSRSSIASLRHPRWLRMFLLFAASGLLFGFFLSYELCVPSIRDVSKIP